MAAPSSTFAANDMLGVYLAGRDCPCPLCGYNLRDLHENRCPECGDELELRVSPVEPKQGLLIAGLVGLSSGAGLSGLLLVYLVIQVFILGRAGHGWESFITITSAGFLVEAAATLFWIGRWKRTRRAAVVFRVLLVIGCWLLTLVNVVVFSLSVR